MQNGRRRCQRRRAHVRLGTVRIWQAMVGDRILEGMTVPAGASDARHGTLRRSRFVQYVLYDSVMDLCWHGSRFIFAWMRLRPSRPRPAVFRVVAPLHSLSAEDVAG